MPDCSTLPTPETIEPASPAATWNLLALLRLAAFGFGINGLMLAMDVVALPILALEVAPAALKNSFLGLLGVAGMAVAAVAQPVVGWCSDRTRTRLGRRLPYLIGGCLLLGGGMALLGFAANFRALLLAWLFVQLNLSLAYGPYQALIQDLVPPRRIGAAASIKILTDAVGGVTLISVSGVLLGIYTRTDDPYWRWLTLGIITANVAICAIITGAIVWGRRPSRVATDARRVDLPQSLRRLHPQLRRFLLSRYLTFTAITAFATYGLFFLQDVVRLPNPAQAVGNMILAVGGALALSVYPAGWVSDRVGRKPVAMAGAIGAALSSLAMLWADSSGEVLVIASVIGASVGALLSSTWALANDIGTAGREAQHIGLVSLATVAGGATAKALGPLVDALNHLNPGWGYAGLLALCAGLFVLGAVILLPLRASARARPLTPASGGAA